MRHAARRRLGLALATTLTLAAAAAAVAPSTAGAAGPADSSASSSYYRAQPACAAARPGHARCFALRRVAVPRSVPGARKATAIPADLPVGPAGGFTPADLAKAYGVNAATATNQTVGIVDAYDDPKALADLNVFNHHYGLPAETATSFRKVGQTGSATALPVKDTTGWSAETSLDLDAVRGLCNKCKIILVEANSSSGDDLAAAVNTAVKLGATEVSNSYGGSENDPTDPPNTTQAKAYNHPGVVITASTGDDGYYDWDYANYGYASTAPPAGTPTGASNTPEVPSSLNTVVAVGGTTLQLNDDGTRAGESVWNENGTFDNTGFYAQAPQGATGGGCSTLYTAQKWQSSAAHYSQTACGTKRLAADVAALADPNTGYDIYDSFQVVGVTACTAPDCWATFGGTSLASPLIAAMWALAGGSGGVAYPSLSLYGHEKSASSSLYDVTVGGNGYCDGVSPGECGSIFTTGSPNTDLKAGTVDCAWNASGKLAAGTRACDAATGYDGPSGVGTPKGLTAFTALAPHAVIAAPTTVIHKQPAAFSGQSSSDPFPGGTITKYRWYWGDGTATSTSATPTHTYAAAGTYTLRLVVADSYGRTSTSTSMQIVVT